METLAIPRTDLQTSRLGYGSALLGTAIPEASAKRLIARFLEGGGTFFDTAHIYAAWLEGGAGASERCLGRCLKELGVLDEVVISSKGGHSAEAEWYPRPDAYLSPERIEADLRDSLDRLGRTCIDLYFLHRDDPRVPVGEIMDCLHALQASGRVRAYGSSNWSLPRIQEAQAYALQNGRPGFAGSQLQWSVIQPNWVLEGDPILRFVTPSMAAWHREMDLLIVTYRVLADGYFEGRSAADKFFDTPGNRLVRERVKAEAERLGLTPSQVAMVWMLQREGPVVALFGTSREEHLNEMLTAERVADTVELHLG